ncbi:MAG: exonuclease SbcCD subunit D [Synergistaceae bacterium]|jgi:exonuclease SbcD|nr:exonuclease SbcCD subunit D [Synergistaceae bacterium]
MKFMHLSDLHIGKTVNGVSMIEEQRHVFGQILGYLRTIKPEAVLVAGDIYDRAVPGVEAVRLFDDFLTDLAGESAAVLLIAGNHDSPERLSYASRLLSREDVFLRGVLDGKMRPVTMDDEYGKVNFWLLPFIKPSSLRGYYGDAEIDGCSDAVKTVIENSGIDFDARNVLISHQFYAGAGIDPIRSDSETDFVGGLDAVDAGILSRFDYAALGHLHRAQSVGGENIRYGGSPLKYSFSEWKHEKSVTLVDIAEKGSVSVSALPLTPIHDMREIKGPIDKLTSGEVLKDADPEDYMRVVLTDRNDIIDAMGKIRSVYPNVMVLDFENPDADKEIGSLGLEDEPVQNVTVLDLFSRFFKEIKKTDMSARQEKIVRELLEKTEGGA